MSPIKLRHVSLIHSQTPINRSLSKAFLQTKTPWERSWNTHTTRHSCHKQHQRRFRRTKTLPKSSPKASRNFKNFDLKCKEHSKHNHLNYLPRSQSSLESNSKASKNLNKPQISEALQIQAFEA